jgi:hypothetical protein
MSLLITRFPVDYLAQKWDEIAPFIDAAVVYADGDYTTEQVKVFLSMQAWLLIVACDADSNIKGAATVSFINMPNDKIAYINTIGGKLISNEDTFQQFTTLLKHHGATKIQGAARASIARLWKRFGFKDRHIIVEKQL